MRCSEKGFTMIELLVAVLILTVGLLGLFKMVYSMVSYNLTNDLRTEAVRYGDDVMARQLNKSFANISTGTSRTEGASRAINAAGFWNFSATSSNVAVSPNTTRVQVLVSWRLRGTRYTHTLSSQVSQ